MDYSPIVAQVWGMLTWFIPAALLIGLLKSPWAKGQIGELLVRLFAHWQLDRQTYRRLHNVTLNTPDGTTQIDHVFLSPYGIFVLETAGFQHLPIGLYRCTGEPCCRSQASVSIAPPLRDQLQGVGGSSASFGEGELALAERNPMDVALCSPPERGKALIRHFRRHYRTISIPSPTR